MSIFVLQGTGRISDDRQHLNDNFAFLADQIAAPVIAGYTQAFVAQTSVTVPGLTHRLGTASLTIAVWDTTGTTNTLVSADTIAVDPVTFDVTVTFGDVQTGILVIK